MVYFHDGAENHTKDIKYLGIEAYHDMDFQWALSSITFIDHAQVREAALNF